MKFPMKREEGEGNKGGIVDLSINEINRFDRALYQRWFWYY
jgi:hypothetical protein